MRGAGAVHDNRPFIAFRQGQAAPGERIAKRDGMARRPCRGEGRAQIGGVDFGALLDVAAFWRKVRDPDGSAQVVVPRHPFSSGVTLFNESAVDGFRTRNGGRGQIEFGGGDDRNLFPPAVAVTEVHDATVRPHETIDEVRVGAFVFSMQDTAPLLILDPEFTFEVAEKDPDRLGVVVADIGVDMDMPHGPVSPSVAGTEDKLPKLPGQAFGRQVAGSDKLDALASFSREKMPRESGTALSPRFTRKHFTAASQ